MPGRGSDGLAVRVAIVSPYSVDVPGGVQGQVELLAAAMERRGNEVDVIAPGERASADRVTGPEPPARRRTIVVGRSLAVPVNGSRAPVSPWPTTMARTVRRLRSGGYDVVHLHEPFAPGPPLAALMSGATPLVATFHRAGTDAAYRALGIAAGRLRGRLAAAVAVSEAARETAAAVLGRRAGSIEVLWNGVDVDFFRAAQPTQSDVPAIVFVGRHERRKGLDTLVRAFTALDVAAELWICGEGPETSTLRAACAGDERISWLGRVSDDEVASRLAGSTIACFPARGGESFGLVVAEAMAAGTAVVVADIPGYRAALGGSGLDGGPDAGGVAVPAEDVAAWSQAIAALLGDPERRARLAEAARRRADSLSLERLADRYAEIYERVASPGGRRRPGSPGAI